MLSAHDYGLYDFTILVRKRYPTKTTFAMQILQAPRASAILYSILIADEEKRPWLLPANICPIVPITFLKARVPFQFVDISARTLHMDLDQAEASIKERKFGGLLYAHTYSEASTPNPF
jgi:hypothetical protein